MSRYNYEKRNQNLKVACLGFVGWAELHNINKIVEIQFQHYISHNAPVYFFWVLSILSDSDIIVHSYK